MKSYLRFLSRNKLYTAIEVVVMSISLAFVIITSCHVWKIISLTWDIEDHEDIYVLAGLTEFSSHSQLQEHLDEIPEIISHSSFSHNECFLKIGTELLVSSVAMVDDGFFDMFPVRIIAGRNELTAKGGGILVSRDFARSQFGTPDDAVGKVVELSQYRDGFSRMTICGVFNGFDGTIFNDADFLAHTDSPIQISSRNSYQTFAKTSDGYGQKELSEKVHELIRIYLPGVEKQIVAYGLNHKHAVPLDEVYLKHSKNGLKTGELSTIIIMMAISLLLLISAILNYVNMSFAQTAKRSGEIATMRLIGAQKAEILKQHIIESVTLTGICSLLAVLISFAAIPTINRILRYQDPISIPVTLDSLIIVLAIVLIVGCLAGLAPALMATRFKPIDVAKGSFQKKRKSVLVNMFICTQNILAVSLIMVAFSVESGTRKMLDTPYGTGSKDIIFIDRNIYGGGDDSQLIGRLEECPFVDGQCGYSAGAIGMASGSDGLDINGNAFKAYILICDSTAFNVFGIEVKERCSNEMIGSFWYSENLMKRIGAGSGANLVSADVFKEERYQVSHTGGVISDFMAVAPGYDWSDVRENGAIFITDEEYWNFIVLKTIGDRKQSLEAIRRIVSGHSVERNGFAFREFAVMYLDDIVKMSMHEQLMIRDFIRLFMIVALLISILGMIAMSYYFADERTCSIAIHKIYGGTVRSETIRNVRSFMYITATACLVGLPLGWYMTRSYLSEFTAEIETFVPQLLATAAVIFTTSLLSVLWQTLRAARTNPAEALKKE